VTFGFNGNSHGYGHFVLELKRSAADDRGGAWFALIGKGAVVCEGPLTRFVVLSLGGALPNR
jgi:hypothetical protein